MFEYKGVKFDTLFDVKTKKVALFFKDVCPRNWDEFVATANPSHCWLKNGGGIWNCGTFPLMQILKKSLMI